MYIHCTLVPRIVCIFERAATHYGVHRDPACACCDSFWRVPRPCLRVLQLILACTSTLLARAAPHSACTATLLAHAVTHSAYTATLLARAAPHSACAASLLACVATHSACAATLLARTVSHSSCAALLVGAGGRMERDQMKCADLLKSVPVRTCTYMYVLVCTWNNLNLRSFGN